MAVGGCNASANKIKGGRWTVFRFFFISLAFTIAWMTVSSLLAHYKLKYGPAILLQMNIAYFLPSIPLLLISSCLDEWLDHTLGIAKTILARLLFGLGGCAVVTAVWPFAHSSHRMLLFLTVVLGLVSGIAFSASYQLVARFANKNTISLGLGCVGSGIVTLIFQVVLQMGPNPTRKQELILFELTAGMIVLGMLAAISLLIRHWAAIEKSIEPQSAEQSLSEGLLEDGNGANTEEEQRAGESRRSISLRKSLSLMLRYAPTPMDPFDTVSDPERMEDRDQLPALDLSPRVCATTRRKDMFWEDESLRPPDIPNPTAHTVFNGLDESPGAEDAPQASNMGGEDGRHEVEVIGVVELLQLLWPLMSALFLVGTILCTVFPFFTYVPSSGLVGDSLPKVLFFIRLFADLMGRTLPRVKFLAVTSQRLLFALACFATGTLPLFFLYLKAPSRLLNDYVVMGYVVCLWGLLGYINTCSYILAPQRVPVYAKGAANGALAIIYQASHCLGLVIALFLAVVMYGEI